MVTLSGSSSSVFSTQTLPVLVGLAEHAGDQVDVDLREVERARERDRPDDLRRAVRAAVELEDAIVEVLDAEAEARDAHAAGSPRAWLSVSVPGSHSNVISSAPFHGVDRGQPRRPGSASCCVERNDGVPPPK